MTTAFDPHADLAYSAVASPPSPASSGVSLGVTTGQGSRFGTVGPFWVLVWPAGAQATPQNSNLLRATGISGDTLTLDRSQDRLATTRVIASGDQIMAPLTAEAVQKIEAAVNALEAAQAASDPAGSAVTARNQSIALSVALGG